MRVPQANYYNAAQNGPIKRINVPVSARESLYARYKYVQGVPARGSVEAVPLSRLKTLNALMAKMNKTPSLPSQKDLKPNQVDYLIDRFTREAHSKINAPSSRYSAGLNPNPVGMVFSTVA